VSEADDGASDFEDFLDFLLGSVVGLGRADNEDQLDPFCIVRCAVSHQIPYKDDSGLSRVIGHVALRLTMELDQQRQQRRGNSDNGDDDDDQGYAAAAARLRRLADAVYTQRRAGKSNGDLETAALAEFARMRAASRAHSVAQRASKAAAASTRSQMDGIHLAAHNRMYEVDHLAREIAKCNDYECANFQTFQLVGHRLGYLAF
jgi:hypothetical protein